MAKTTIQTKVKKEIQGFVGNLRADNLPIDKIFLFGSYAKGNPTKWSDIDLCVISPKFKNPWLALQYLWSKRIKDSGLTIEPIGFNSADFKKEDSLTNEIKMTGIELSI